MTGTTPIDTIIQGDCLEEMKKLPDGCIDMVLCDLPYGTTACKWDHVIPFEPLWKEYKRLIKDRGAIVLTASQPFTSMLVMSNPTMFKYCWIWKKSQGTNFINVQNAPMKYHEDVLIFSKGTIANCSPSRMVYFPQNIKPSIRKRKNYDQTGTTLGNRPSRKGEFIQKYEGYPTSILEFPNDGDKTHPTAKPVALFEYLIKTYTNEGDLVLDNCIGSGTTAVACKRTGRHFIGIELSEEYCEIARKRVAAVPARLDRWAEAEG
jgi:site-specific DNA-methyltransferase (adenine-specific)